MHHNISGHIHLKALGLKQSVVRGGVLLSLRHIPRQRHLEAFLGLKEGVLLVEVEVAGPFVGGPSPWTLPGCNRDTR